MVTTCHAFILDFCERLRLEDVYYTKKRGLEGRA